MSFGDLIRTVDVTRYVTPLREGGSLPAIVEASDGFLYVLKFKGAGQGVKSLIAEFIAGELARALGFRIPELVFAHLDEAFGRAEPDEEIQDLLKASTGLNLGLHYLSGSNTFDALVTRVDPVLASQILWFDCLITNVDRTARNTNMLMWNKQLWLIDHGASLYFQHTWHNWEEQAKRTFPQIKDHVLLFMASDAEMEKANADFQALLTEELIRTVIARVPEEWMLVSLPDVLPADQREVYLQFLMTRLSISSTFAKQAQHARKALI